MNTPKSPIPFRALKVYYVLCGTKGKKIEYSYASRINASKGTVHLWSNDGKNALGGWMPIKHCFLSKQQAREDWRRRSDAETKEHIDIIRSTAQTLLNKADRIKVREQCDWRDL